MASLRRLVGSAWPNLSKKWGENGEIERTRGRPDDMKEWKDRNAAR
jgi:hypothetical protein